MNIFYEIGQTFGVPVALLVFFLWRDLKERQSARVREKDLAERLNQVEDFVKNDLMQLTQSVTKALESNSSVMRVFYRVLSDRPCIAEEMMQKEHEKKGV